MMHLVFNEIKFITFAYDELDAVVFKCVLVCVCTIYELSYQLCLHKEYL